MEGLKKVVVKIECKRDKSIIRFDEYTYDVDSKSTFKNEEFVPFLEMLDSVSLEAC